MNSLERLALLCYDKLNDFCEGDCFGRKIFGPDLASQKVSVWVKGRALKIMSMFQSDLFSNKSLRNFQLEVLSLLLFVNSVTS